MKAYDLGAKAIIFSQFVNMLDVSHLMHSAPLTCFTSLFFPYPQPLVLYSIVPYPIPSFTESYSTSLLPAARVPVAERGHPVLQTSGTHEC